ncbi:sialidase family protein [Bremerella sp. JC770]|uniref:sialidase family protein n=1 Tax=Bremerella sp. JC770 TaxID=3232137 RepID=UPI003458FB6E
MRHLRLIFHGSAMLLIIAALTTSLSAELLHVVENGVAQQVRFEGPAWSTHGEGLQGQGVGNVAWASRSITGPTAHVRMELVLNELNHTAASISLGPGSQFGLDGAGNRLFVQGPVFGGATKFLESAKPALQAGKPFLLELISGDGRLSISIDGNQVYEGPLETPLGMVGLRPWRSTMSVRQFTIDGDLSSGNWLPKKLGDEITVPTIDLAHDNARQTVVARGTKDVYQGHPTTLLMPDGKTIFAAWTYNHGGQCGPLKRSDDGGLTWSDLIEVPENWSRAPNCPCLHRLVDSEGTARLFVFAGRGDMLQSVSLDEGKTWSPMQKNGLKCIVAPITILPIHNGAQHLAIYHRGAGDRDRPPLEIWQATSSDGGLTWQDQRMVAAVDGANPCEPFLLRSPDGKQLMCLMRENARRLNSLVMVSDDEGKTWTVPQEVNAALTGDRHCARYTEDGRLVIAMRDVVQKSPTYGHFVVWVGNYDDILAGRPGQYRARLLENHGRKLDTGYPGLERLPDGTFVATTYVGYRPDEKNSVVSVRFTMDELDRLAKQHQPNIIWKSGEDGYDTYRIPALIQAKDGTLLAMCEGRRNSRSDTGAIDLVMKRSTDQGKTWSDQVVVWKDKDNTCGNPCPVVDQTTGRIHLLLTHNLGEDHESDIKLKKSKGTRTVWVCHSDDHGKTWTDPVEITRSTKKPQWGWYATGPGVGIQLKHGPHQGRLVVPCDHSYPIDPAVDKRGYGFGSHVIYSDDHGASWELGGTIHPGMNECQVVEIGDQGHMVIDMRSYRGQGCRAQAVSTDGGQTWSEIADARELVSPVCQASLIRAQWPTTDEPGMLLFSSPRDPSKRRNLTVLASFDDNKTWPWNQTLYPGHTAYSCLARLGDGQAGCLAEVGQSNPYETISLFLFDLPKSEVKNP